MWSIIVQHINTTKEAGARRTCAVDLPQQGVHEAEGSWEECEPEMSVRERHR